MADIVRQLLGTASMSTPAWMFAGLLIALICMGSIFLPLLINGFGR